MNFFGRAEDPCARLGVEVRRIKMAGVSRGHGRRLICAPEISRTRQRRDVSDLAFAEAALDDGRRAAFERRKYLRVRSDLDPIHNTEHRHLAYEVDRLELRQFDQRTEERRLLVELGGFQAEE